MSEKMFNENENENVNVNESENNVANENNTPANDANESKRNTESTPRPTTPDTNPTEPPKSSYTGEPQQNGNAQPGYNPQQGYNAQNYNPQPNYNAQQSYNAQQNPHSYAPYNPAPAPVKEKKKKAKRSGISGGAVAILCSCSLLLSCASGFFGAYLATAQGSTGTSSSSTTQQTPTVFYQSAESPTNGLSTSAGSSRYYDVASAVKDSVVEITTEFRVNSYFQYVTSGAGSGVILSSDGYIITNNHVISDSSSSGSSLADTITVRLTNGEEYPATVIGADSDSDIAVIKIEANEALPCAVIGNSDNLGVGEEVVAVGNPLGELGGTVTNGIISALNREINVDGTTMNLLQTNTAINPGNSGGGLFNMAGELIGIVNAKSSGTDIEGLGFAIPITEAINIAEQLMTQGYVSGRPYIGVEFYNASTIQSALYYGLPSTGVYVFRLEEGLNDDVFQLADRVIAVDGHEITDASDIVSLVKAHAPGDTITFSVYRSGKLIEVNATCYEYVPELNQVEEQSTARS